MVWTVCAMLNEMSISNKKAEGDSPVGRLFLPEFPTVIALLDEVIDATALSAKQNESGLKYVRVLRHNSRSRLLDTSFDRRSIRKPLGFACAVQQTLARVAPKVGAV